MSEPYLVKIEFTYSGGTWGTYTQGYGYKIPVAMVQSSTRIYRVSINAKETLSDGSVVSGLGKWSCSSAYYVSSVGSNHTFQSKSYGWTSKMVYTSVNKNLNGNVVVKESELLIMD